MRSCKRLGGGVEFVTEFTVVHSVRTNTVVVVSDDIVTIIIIINFVNNLIYRERQD